MRKRASYADAPVNRANAYPEPLYIIEGKLEDDAKFKQLNPQDIESIEVIKGYKAAALCGTRGINGVMVLP